MQVRSLRASLLALLLLTACGTPPHKEMEQAQGAIDAARAAGAERYAAEELAAATGSLTLATNAAKERDNRLALNHALESREHAQNATRIAAEARQRLHSDVERAMTEMKQLLAQANGRLASAEKSRLPRRTIDDARKSIAAANDDVQKAGAADQAQDFSAAQAALSGAKKRVSQTITRLDAAMRPQNVRRRN
jgi:hypothetical protein